MVLGFEVHIELATNSKMFCGCPADHFGKPPNSQVCPVCLGLPGALPVPNARAIEWCIKLGLALGCQVNLKSKFDRKNYFYPDLPKGYQISQYDQPFCHSGNLLGHKITRIHLEEDTGKLQHQGTETWIDFNRSGVPLVEIVTEPDFATTTESDEFLKEIQAIVRTLGISSGDMEKGSLRLEANVSMRKLGETQLPDYRVEIKNVNSFRFVKKAIEFEVTRQTELLESGQTPLQETRGFSESNGETVGQRGKEEAHDYRYFPEPDIPPFEFTPAQIEEWRSQLPPLPSQIRQELISLGISSDTAATIVASATRLSKYKELSAANDPKAVTKLLANLPEDQVSNASMHDTLNADIDQETVKNVLAANPKAVADYKSGKQQALFFLIGQLRKQQKKLNVPLAKKIIEELI